MQDNVHKFPDPRKHTQEFDGGCKITVEGPEALTVAQTVHLLEYTKFLLLLEFQKDPG